MRENTTIAELERKTMPVELITIPCLADNYAYLLRDSATETVTLIDAPEAAPILAALYERGWKLSHILLTHHHPDHIDGVPMLEAATGARVIGAAADAHRLPALTEEVAPGDLLPIGIEEVQVIAADGHTRGHVAYYFPRAGLLFSGDSLMAWGCGRLFEGTPAEMAETLARFGGLPETVLVCSGHEYSAANGRFALSLEPAHKGLLARMARVEALRAEGAATVPVSLAEERATNPFLRLGDAGLRAALGLETVSDLQVFTELRARRNQF